MASGCTTPLTIRLAADKRQDAAGVATVDHQKGARKAPAQEQSNQTCARTLVEGGKATERSLMDSPSGLFPACSLSPIPLTQEEDDLLPPYTMEERMRELRQRLVLLRWRAQRLRTRSM
jgi:hypothetical protein